MNAIHFTLRNDDSDDKLVGRIEVDRQQITIFFDGYNTAGPEDEQRPPIVIQRNELGNPELSVWAMIVNEDPTHKVALGGASENYRYKPAPSIKIMDESLDVWQR